MGRAFRLGKSRCNKELTPPHADKNNKSMISIWDSGIEYGQYEYGAGG